MSKDHLGKLLFQVHSTYMHVSWKPEEHSPAIIDRIMYEHRLLSHSGDILVLQFRNPVYHVPRYFDFKGLGKGTSKFKPSHKVCVLSLLCKWSIKLASLFFLVSWGVTWTSRSFDSPDQRKCHQWRHFEGSCAMCWKSDFQVWTTH